MVGLGVKLLPVCFQKPGESLDWVKALNYNLTALESLCSQDDLNLRNILDQEVAEPGFWDLLTFLQEFCRKAAELQLDLNVKLHEREDATFADVLPITQESYWLVRATSDLVLDLTSRLSLISEPRVQLKAVTLMDLCQTVSPTKVDELYNVLKNVIQGSTEHYKQNFGASLQAVPAFVESIRREYDANDSDLAADLVRFDLQTIVSMCDMLTCLAKCSKQLLQDVVEFGEYPTSTFLITIFEVVTHLQPKIKHDRELGKLAKVAKRMLCECFYEILNQLYASHERFSSLQSIVTLQLNADFVESQREHLVSCSFITDVDIACDLSGWFRQLVESGELTEEDVMHAEFLMVSLDHNVKVSNCEHSKRIARNKRMYVADMLILYDRPMEEHAMKQFREMLSSTDVPRDPVQQIAELFPDLGAGFIESCLEKYDNNPETVIAAILNDSLEESLRDLDRSASKNKVTPFKTAPAGDVVVGKRIKDFLETLQPHVKEQQSFPEMKEQDRAAVISVALNLEEQERKLYEDDYDDTFADVGEKGSIDSGNPLTGHQSTLLHYYTADPTSFETRNRKSESRIRLKKELGDTQVSDEMIEGWATMLKRNPNLLERAFLDDDWRGNKSVASQELHSRELNVDGSSSSDYKGIGEQRTAHRGEQVTLGRGRARGRGGRYQGNKHHKVADKKRAMMHERAFQS